jgi:uncharacterized protein (TIGR00255 family)
VAKNKSLQSMTGFGRSFVEENNVALTCEIRSVNHRGLDVKMRLPRELASCESDFIHLVQQHFSRGRIDISLTLSHQFAGHKKVSFDAASAGAIVDALLDFGQTRPSLNADLRLSDLLYLRELFVIEEADDLSDEVKPLALHALEQALTDLLQARQEEGENLYLPITASITSCESIVADLRTLTQNAPKQHFDQLSQRIKDLVAQQGIDPVRLAQEAAYLADKSDVSEELERLLAHFKHFKSLCLGEKASGRKLDFLCQEMFREANTIGSKCADAASSYRVVELKAEVERLREQVQNIE